MYNFIIKAAKPSDRFYIEEATEHIYLFCRGYNDLKKTLRCITPQRIKIGHKRKLAKYFSLGHAVLNHPLFKTNMFEIKIIPSGIKTIKEVDYTNPYGCNHQLKLTSVDNWFGTDLKPKTK